MKKSPINKISKKQQARLKAWKLVTAQRILDVGGKCEGILKNKKRCNSKGDFRGLTGHHKQKRRFRNDTYDNCIILCGKCHSAAEGLKEIDSQPDWSKRL